MTVRAVAAAPPGRQEPRAPRRPALSGPRFKRASTPSARPTARGHRSVPASYAATISDRHPAACASRSMPRRSVRAAEPTSIARPRRALWPRNASAFSDTVGVQLTAWAAERNIARMKCRGVVVWGSALSTVLLSVMGCGGSSNTDTNAGGAGGSSAVGKGGSTPASGSGGAGAGAGAATATCDPLTALQTCFSAFCKAGGAGTPFCTCFVRGYDLGAAPACECVTFNATAFCQQAEANGLIGSDLDCPAATSAVATQCVGAQ